MVDSKLIVSIARIENLIYFFRGQKVMLDSDLAELYEVETGVLMQAVRRNIGRFPEDFMFQLLEEEWEFLISQIVISKKGRGGRRKRPHVFTEQGVAMLSSVLKSERAVKVNIEIMRAFVRLRMLIASHAELAKRLTELEKKYDGQFGVIFQAIREMVKQPGKEQRRIGFRTSNK
ncbi:MAG: ORF6N domain-containing protein [bacterium]|nr:ORF6N domain-containing protein [bacterium]